MSSVITRFAPSPTGFLHIGGARTALFNWLYAKRFGGTFLLRIEDTDRERSTQAAVDAILDGLKWLGLNWDGEAISQFQRAERHREVAEQLLGSGGAYRCYASVAELEQMREKARLEGKPMRYDGRWRDRDPAEAPPGVKPVIRLRAQQDGETIIDDKVQGKVVFANKDLDDLVLLRSDGNPTYMLAVVVDDHDMGVTHIIRGDDHLTNAARQTQIYQALGWDVPIMAHIPLIHGPDGAKLSKRHGALGVDAYRAMGYLPVALRNYLARLGWSHGDKEFFSTEELIAAFDLGAIGRSPSRFDFAKLENVNGHYMRAAGDDELFKALIDALPYLARRTRGHGETRRAEAGPASRRDSGLEGARQDAGRIAGRRWIPVRGTTAEDGCEGRGNSRPRGAAPSQKPAAAPDRTHRVDGGRLGGCRARLRRRRRRETRDRRATLARRPHRPLDLAGHLRRAHGARARREPRADLGSGRDWTKDSTGTARGERAAYRPLVVIRGTICCGGNVASASFGTAARAGPRPPDVVESARPRWARSPSGPFAVERCCTCVANSGSTECCWLARRPWR